jgi:cobalt-zinc-cadmium efflux system membrane fusion protein
MKKIVYTTIMLVALTATFSCKEKKEEVKGKKGFCLSDTAQKMMAFDSAKMCDVEDEIQLSGEVSFDENKVNKVFPRGSGQVIECKVTLGDKVEAGQVLAVVRSAEIAGSYADLTSAEADIAIAKRQLDNQESLYKNGIASERELTEAKQNYEKAKAAKHKIEVMLSINGGNKTNAGGTYYLTAPIGGYIVEKKVNAGNFLRGDMGDYLFTISDLKNVWIMANVFETDIPKVKEGYSVKVTTLAYPDKEFKGTIEKVSEVLDPTNKALKVRIRLDNPGMLLKPEMFTKVIVNNKQNSRSICIPKTAVVEESGKTYAILFKSNCDLKVVEINILKTVGDKTYISGGIAVGDKIVTKGALLIYDEFTDNQ